MKATAIASNSPSPLVSEAVRERARAALRQYYGECFWFWNPEAPLQTVDDVRSVIEQLRKYGDKKAWRVAQDLVKCL